MRAAQDVRINRHATRALAEGRAALGPDRGSSHQSRISMARYRRSGPGSRAESLKVSICFPVYLANGPSCCRGIWSEGDHGHARERMPPALAGALGRFVLGPGRAKTFFLPQKTARNEWRSTSTRPLSIFAVSSLESTLAQPRATLSDLNGHTARTTTHAPHAWIAARSGLIPTMFITRVRL
jgi:hypothetical protein